jgi:hypothetical protein
VIEERKPMTIKNMLHHTTTRLTNMHNWQMILILLTFMVAMERYRELKEPINNFY